MASLAHPSICPRLELAVLGEGAGGGEFGRRIEDTTNKQREDEIPVTSTRRPENTIEADLARGAERGGDAAETE